MEPIVRGSPTSDASVDPRRNPAPRRKRAPVACRRCRRLRSKCVHESESPCDLCRAAGDAIAAECVFPSRSRAGPRRDLQLSDRDYRKRSLKSPWDKTNVAPCSSITEMNVQLDASRGTEVTSRSPMTTTLNPVIKPSTDINDRTVLPPFDEVLEGGKVFFSACFQLGFLPKAIFLERLATDQSSVSLFLLLCILSVSARFTNCLVQRYGDATKATDYFINHASTLLLNEIYEPNIERIQALFLFAVSDWTQGNRTRSAIHMGIAVRMAGILHLHREESYALADNATPTDIIDSEVSRRTFWILQSQDHLYSEHNAAVSFPLTDITALLPCDETDFNYGAIPYERAALGGTQAALKDPKLCSLQSRSAWATLIQAHSFWGEIARRAGRASKSEREKADEKVKPWEHTSEYSQLTRSLEEWEKTVPVRHRWSLNNFRGHKAEVLDLAYLSQVMVVRICNIVIRRIYLEDILASRLGTLSSEHAVPEFWTQMSHELFTNVYTLHESFDTWFSLRSVDEGIPSIVVFCVYICGSLASYLWKWPQLCPELADGAEAILARSLEVLAALVDKLPQVSKWLQALRRIAVPMHRIDLDAHGNPLILQKDVVSQSEAHPIGMTPMTLQPETPDLEVRDRSNTQNWSDREAGVDESTDGISQNTTDVIRIQPITINELTWDMAQPQSDDTTGWINSLDLESGYSFDEELMRLLQGEM